MKKIFLADYLGCILFRVLGPFLRMLPVRVSLFLGRRLGDCFYYLDLRHRARVFANLKRVLGDEKSPEQLFALAKEFYQSFGESIIEVFLIPMIDSHYIAQYIQTSNEGVVKEALKKGRGVILVAVHAGSWELSNVISANLGFPYSYLVRGQSLPRLNRLLNKYRRNRGCKIITREEGLRGLIGALKSNQAVGITVDQGGKSGVLVDFFGKTASMATGAIKLALKYDVPLIPVFFTRIQGPRMKVWAGEEICLKKSGDVEEDLKDNLKMVVSLFEDFIRRYPKDYLWTYKIWKYSGERQILLLSDAKPGHLRQSEALLKSAERLFAQRGIKFKVRIMEVKFNSRIQRVLLNIFASFLGSSQHRLFFRFLKVALPKDVYLGLYQANPDFIISAGSSLAGLNFMLSSINSSKSLLLMRPGFLSAKKFDLIVMQRHDSPRSGKNIAVIDGALNLIDEDYLKEKSAELSSLKKLDVAVSYIGVFIGGKSKGFSLSPALVGELIEKVKLLSLRLKMDLLVSTSRRTPPEVEDLIKKELKGFARAKLLVIASEDNPVCTVGGIMGLSKVLILSPESISMISEAVNSKKHVFVFNAPYLSSKHSRFLKYLAGNGKIFLTGVNSLDTEVIRALENNFPAQPLGDRELVEKHLQRIL